LSSKRDYYEILSLERTATADEVRSAYRKLALKYHPDRNPGDKEAEARFKEAAEAYSVLSDGDKRRQYDQFGHAGVNGQVGAGHGGFSVEDIFSAFGDIFGGMGGGGMGGFSFEELFTGRRGGARRGASLRVDLQLTLEEVASGVEKTIDVARLGDCETCSGSGAKPGTRPQACGTCGGHGEIVQSQGFFSLRRPCPHCQGTGKVVQHPCATCRGAGKVRQRERKKVHVPPGIEEGHVERLPGQGEAGDGGGPPGDLVLVVHVKPHDFFERDGADLLCEVTVRFAQAALGDTIHIPTFDKPIEMKVPAGTQPGQILRLKGLGLPRADGRGKGNLLVRVQVTVPRKLNARQSELLKELDGLDADKGERHSKGKGLFEKIKDIF
jgi:molecular chaperone DnaJ